MKSDGEEVSIGIMVTAAVLVIVVHMLAGFGLLNLVNLIRDTTIPVDFSTVSAFGIAVYCIVGMYSSLFPGNKEIDTEDT